MRGLQIRTSPVTSLVAPLCSLFPVVTVILSVIFLGEKPTLSILTAVIVSTIAGIIIPIEKRPETLLKNKRNSELTN